MSRRGRFLIILILITAAAAWCGSQVGAEDRARPRERAREKAQTERRRDSAPPKADRQHERRHPRPDSDVNRDRRDNRRDDADRNHNGRYDAQRRHPRPDGRYDRNRYRDNRRDWGRYHWRRWSHRDRWDRDWFPRFYFGLRLFDDCRYRGRVFGPHYRLWYLHRNTWLMFYWPYPYAPSYGCGWYWVPTEQRLVYDEDGYEYWDYTDYRYIMLCFD